MDTFIGAGARAPRAVMLGKGMLTLGAGSVCQVLGSQGAPTTSTGRNMWAHNWPGAIDAGLLVLILMGIVHVVLETHQRTRQHYHRLTIASKSQKSTLSETVGIFAVPVAFPCGCLLFVLLLIPCTEATQAT
eukprot:1885286-Prymnesium_polylepis.1